MGPYFRMGHVSRRWGLAQLACVIIICACAVNLAIVGRRSFTGWLGYLAFAAFAGLVVLSFLSKRENDKDQKPSI